MCLIRLDTIPHIFVSIIQYVPYKHKKAMENKHKVFNLIILDESGSMQSIKQATINGFNEVVQTVRGVEKQFPEQEHYI